MDKRILLEAVDKFPSVLALVVGDVMLDVYEYCLTSQSRLLQSEKAGKRAYRAQKAVKVLGGAGNVAANLASLNVKTQLTGVTGNDDGYFKIRELCGKLGVTQSCIRDASRPTTTKARLYIDNEYVLRRDEESTDKLGMEAADALLKEILRLLPQNRVVILSDYNKGVFTEALTQQVIKECATHSIPSIVDFKPANAALFRGADLMVPNENEARELVADFSRANLEKSVRSLHGLLKCKAAAVTLGENGIAGFDGKAFFHVPGLKVKALDAVGCGDTVRAGLALGLSLGLSLEESAELANLMAAVIVQKPNTSSLTVEELKAFIHGR